MTKPFFIRYNDLAKEIWSRGQAVKTPPLHGGIRGSIPLEITKKTGESKLENLLLFSVKIYGNRMGGKEKLPVCKFSPPRRESGTA